MSSHRDTLSSAAGVEIAVLPAACGDDDGAVQATMRGLHDALVEMTGATRRSAVWWRRFHGRTECRRALDELYPPDPARSPEGTAGLNQLHSYFESHPAQCVLIVASCEVNRNEALADPTGPDRPEGSR